MLFELSLFYGVVILSLLVLIFTIAFGFRGFKDLSRPFRYILYYLVMVLGIELIAKYLMLHGFGNHQLIPPYTAIEFLLLGLFYLEIAEIDQKKPWIALIGLGALYLILPAVDRRLAHLVHGNKMIEHIVFIVLSARLMLNSLNQLKYGRFQQGILILNLGIFCYFSTAMLIFYVLPYSFGEETLNNIILWLINAVMTIVLYLSCMTGFYQTKSYH